jgi:hypothetical protein
MFKRPWALTRVTTVIVFRRVIADRPAAKGVTNSDSFLQFHVINNYYTTTNMEDVDIYLSEKCIQPFHLPSFTIVLLQVVTHGKYSFIHNESKNSCISYSQAWGI